MYQLRYDNFGTSAKYEFSTLPSGAFPKRFVALANVRNNRIRKVDEISKTRRDFRNVYIDVIGHALDYRLTYIERERDRESERRD